MAVINWAFLFSFSFTSAKPSEVLLTFILRVRSWRYLRWWSLHEQGLQHNSYLPSPSPLPHRGWYPFYSLFPPAAMSYQDSDITFHPRLTLIQSPSHGKNNPADMHTPSHSSLKMSIFLGTAKDFYPWLIIFTALEAASQGEGPWHQGTAKECYLC